MFFVLFLVFVLVLYKFPNLGLFLRRILRQIPRQIPGRSPGRIGRSGLFYSNQATARTGEPSQSLIFSGKQLNQNRSLPH